MFGFLSIMLLVGIVARAKVSVLQRFLLPSCLAGGVLGMILVNTGVVGIKFDDLETFAYHFFNISFISVGLTGSEKSEREDSGGGLLRGAAWMALVQGVSFPLQAIMGGLVVIALGLFGTELFPTFGFLAPLGFNEGPGQALSIGAVWESKGFEFGSTVGLTFAAMGFFFAFFVGVPIANWGMRKGISAQKLTELPPELLTGINPTDREPESAGKLTLNSANVDTFAFQAALVGLVYVIGYLAVKGLGGLVGPDLAEMLWGFFFFFGLIIALIARWVMERVGVVHLVDSGVQRRITGWSIDFLIVATVAAIKAAVVWKYILPIGLISLLAGVSTTVVILYLGRRLKRYNLERILAIYGTTTGVVSSGLLLLRIVDPDFKTPAALELAVMNLFTVPIILLGLFFLTAPVVMGWSIWLALLGLFALMTVSLIIIKLLGFWGPTAY